MVKKQNIYTFNSNAAGNISIFMAMLLPVVVIAIGVEVYTEAATYLPSDTALDIALVLDRTGSMAGSNFKLKLKLKLIDIKLFIWMYNDNDLIIQRRHNHDINHI